MVMKVSETAGPEWKMFSCVNVTWLSASRQVQFVQLFGWIKATFSWTTDKPQKSEAQQARHSVHKTAFLNLHFSEK